MDKTRDNARKKLITSLLGFLEKEAIEKGGALIFVECSMYEAVMKFTKGNQVNAAKVIGVSRGTLRTKLKYYFGTVHVGGLYHEKISIKNKQNKINPTVPLTAPIKEQESDRV